MYRVLSIHAHHHLSTPYPQLSTVATPLLWLNSPNCCWKRNSQIVKDQTVRSFEERTV